MNAEATMQKALYSLDLYASQHPEHAEVIRSLEKRMAESFEIGDVAEAIDSAAKIITEREKIECATFGLFCYQVRLGSRDPSHPDLALCDTLGNVIGGTVGWQLPHPLIHYRREIGLEPPSEGPRLE